MRPICLYFWMTIVFLFAVVLQPAHDFLIDRDYLLLAAVALVAGAAHAGLSKRAGPDISIHASLGGGMIAMTLLNWREWHYVPQPAPAAEIEMIVTVVSAIALMVLICNLAAVSTARMARKLTRQPMEKPKSEANDKR